MRDLMFAAILGRYVQHQRKSAAWIALCLIASLAFIGCDGGLPYAPDAAAPQRPNLPPPEAPSPEGPPSPGPVPVPAPTPSPDMESPVPGPPPSDPENDDDDDAENGDEDDGSQAPGLPPEPSMVAPPLSSAQETPFIESVDFLWNGETPIQQGLDPAVFDERRIAVVRGQVWDRMGEPVAGVEITVQGRSEYGYTFTRTDGGFDLAVNGGTAFVLSYEHADYLPLHRQIKPLWADYAIAPDVVLTALDPAVTEILADSDQMQVARGTLQADLDGFRQATVLFPARTHATMHLSSHSAWGETVALSSLRVRATEYTVGADGLAAMPATLPRTSGYTYAVELSVDEALEAGATRVDFSQPVSFYVENFLGFPVGEAVPNGYYDRQQRQWVASENGRVIAILGVETESGRAAIDLEGHGQPATDDELAAMGISADEERQLAALYASGQELWRVPIRHFTPWDCNWPYGPPLDAEAPMARRGQNGIESLDSGDGNCASGCIIEAQRQVVGEHLPIMGTPFSLHYRSHTVPGYLPARSIDIPITGPQVPESLQAVQLTIDIAGQTIRENFAPSPNQVYTFTWDGLDGYGRSVTGSALAVIRIENRYPLIYYRSRSDLQQSFARVGTEREAGLSLSPTRESQAVDLSRIFTKTMRASPGSQAGIGGWTPSIHHRYEPKSGTLWFGTGDMRRLKRQGVIDTVANAVTPVVGHELRASSSTADIPASLQSIKAIATGPDGGMYLADDDHRIKYLAPDGKLTVVAGTGEAGFSGDEGPAIIAQFDEPSDVALGFDGSIYIADSGNGRIRRIDPSGTIRTVAGIGGQDPLDGEYGPIGDGGPATEALLLRPEGVAVEPDGGIYIADSGMNLIRHVGSDGIITTVAGQGGSPGYGDGGPAIDAILHYPKDIALGPDGSLYIADLLHHRIRRVGTDGIITTVAGNGIPGDSGDGALATDARIGLVFGIAVQNDGSIYIADSEHHRLRRVDPAGFISTIAGTGQSQGVGDRGDGGLAAEARLQAPRAIAMSPDGSLYLGEGNGAVRSVSPQLPQGDNRGESSDIRVPSPAGDEVYIFSAGGLHKRTIHAITGAVLFAFAYDNADRLVAVTDGDGDVTTIERDQVTGQATAIVAPDQQRTVLMFDEQGYLVTVESPTGDRHGAQYQPGGSGLMTAFVDPNDHRNEFSYDGQGRLEHDRNAGGGGWTLAREDTAVGEDTIETVTLTSAQGRATRYQVISRPGGARQHSVERPDGSARITIIEPDGTETTTLTDGTVVSIRAGPDPQNGMHAPLAAEQTVTFPSGLAVESSHRRQVIEDPVTEALISRTDTVTTGGFSSTIAYDAATRTFTITSPEGRVSTTVIDHQGRPVTIHRPGFFPIYYDRDDRGRLVTIRQGEGDEERTSTVEYHDNGLERGLVHTMTDPTQQRVSWAYDLIAHVTETTLPGERTIRTRYDGVGNLLELTPPGRTAHSWLYTSLDLPQTYRPPAIPGIANPETSFTYNTDQQLESFTRADSQRLDYDYLADGRLSSMITAAGRHEYGYDPVSRRLESITAPDGNQLVYEHDGALLTAQSWHGAFVDGTVGYQYNNLLWLDRLTIAGIGIGFDYDRDGLLVQAGTLTLDRDPLSGFVTGTSLGIITDRWLLTPFGELAEFETSVGNESVYGYEVVTDKLGRIRVLTETIDGVTTVYDYDYTPAGQLARVHHNGALIASYGYDANGNRTRINGIEVATFDSQDRIDSHATDSHHFVYGHNDHGEVVRKQELASGRITNYDRDVFGNLRRVYLPDGTVIDYIIDGQHRRIGKLVDGNFPQGFLYQDQLNPVAELDGAGNVVARFIYGARANVPEYIIRDDATYRIVSDYRGSPRLVIHADTGAIVQRIDYDVWGRVTADSNPGFQPFGFAGGIYDHSTELVHFGAREYDPHLGRWMSKDPTGFGGGDTNLYAYAGSDPVNYIDPNGELAFFAPLLWGVFVQAAGGAAMDAAVELGSQLLDSDGDIGCVNWGSVGGSALTGAAQGAAGGAIGNLAKVARAARAARGGVCFVAGTLVETEDGLRPIEEIEVGDLVWSRDDETGEEGWKAVVQTFFTPEQPVFDLDLIEADGDQQELLVTAEHPLWTTEGWVAVGNLSVGDAVWARDGWAEVVSVDDAGEQQTVYNFEVADFHTYFVGNGGIWAHNTCPRGLLSELDGVPWGKYCRSGCEGVAEKIQSTIGGKIHRIEPGPPGARRLGRRNDQATEWAYHEVVVKDGRVYDAMTGPGGQAIDEFKAAWQYAEDINFGF